MSNNKKQTRSTSKTSTKPTKQIDNYSPNLKENNKNEKNVEKSTIETRIQLIESMLQLIRQPEQSLSPAGRPDVHHPLSRSDP